MSTLLRSRLFRQQFLVLAVLTGILMAFLAAGLFFRTRAEIESREKDIAGFYRDAAMIAITDWLSEREGDLAWLALTLEAGAAQAGSPLPPSPHLSFRPLLETKNDFSDLLILGLDGYVLHNKAGIPSRRVNLADRDYFVAAREGGAFVSEVFRNRLTGRYSFALSRPLRFQGRITAVLAGTVLLSDLVGIVDQLTLGDLGALYIVDVEGRLVAGSPFHKMHKDPDQVDIVLDNFLVREVVQRRTGTGRYPGESGRAVVGAYGWCPRLALGIVVEFSGEKALLPVTRLLEFFAEFAAGIVVLQLILAYAASSRLVRPIRAMAEAAGNLEIREIPEVRVSRTHTELDTLVAAFNRMARTVRDREGLLRESAARDSLTSLYNHAKIEEFLELEFRRNRRENRLVCFVMLDIDNFKAINDINGHQAGDAILREMGRLLERSGRKGDIIGRYGGEEFAVILNSRNSEEAGAYCERIRKAVEASRFEHEGAVIRITASLGYACCGALVGSPFELVRAADRALYAAKQAGRNQVSAGTL